MATMNRYGGVEMKISFDFDNTLTVTTIQQYAKRLASLHDVLIITSREDPVIKSGSPTWNADLFDMANWLGVSYKSIIFTNLEKKYNVLQDSDILFHLDDDSNEIKAINQYCYNPITGKGTMGIWTHDDWFKKCEGILNEHIRNNN